jgi:hypothetical protein
MAFFYPDICQMQQFLNNHSEFKEHRLRSRFFKHQDLMAIIGQLPEEFVVEEIGQSFENRALKLIKTGTGPRKIFLWSQMHGDEATGTMAIMDLLNLLQSEIHKEAKQKILENCSLYILPMVNPDGAERFTRRNAQQLDINRDFLQCQSIEAKLLKQTQEKIKPHFGFNLHDQSNLWTVKGTRNPAALSFLAPAFDDACSLNANRIAAMQIIAAIHEEIKTILPDQIGLFDDTFEPRAFGDNFQASGMATVLIEGGTIIGDKESQEVRKIVFTAILKGLHSIATEDYLQQTTGNYSIIPKNNKAIFHILIHQIEIAGIITSIGINYKASAGINGTSIEKIYTIEDLGDLSTMNGHQVYQAETLYIAGEITCDTPADFDLIKDDEIILSFRKGILQSKR